MIFKRKLNFHNYKYLN